MPRKHDALRENLFFICGPKSRCEHTNLKHVPCHLRSANRAGTGVVPVHISEPPLDILKDLKC